MDDTSADTARDAAGPGRVDRSTDEASTEGASTDAAATGPAPAAPATGFLARRRALRAARKAAPRKKAPWWELPVLILVAILVAIVVKSFLVQPFYIPSSSMEKTLHGCDGCSGDRVIVNKPVYTVFRDPHPGDIVVFERPASWPLTGVDVGTPPTNPIAKGVRWFGQLVGVVPPDDEVLIKRVIAVGGQTVKCCDAQGNVQISDDGPNGTFRSLDDSSYVYEEPGAAEYGQLPFGPVTIPEGRLWVMGDHRNNSADSRYNCGGAPGPDNPVCVDASTEQIDDATVPVDNVIGKAVLIAWPPSRWTTLGTPPTFESIPLPDAAANVGLASLATVGPLGIGLLGAMTTGGWRRRRRRFAGAGGLPPGGPPVDPLTGLPAGFGRRGVGRRGLRRGSFGGGFGGGFGRGFGRRGFGRGFGTRGLIRRVVRSAMRSDRRG